MDAYGTRAVDDATAKAEKFDFGAKTRALTGWQGAAVAFLCVLYSAFHLAVLNVVHMDEWVRSEEHTSEFQSLMRISYAVFCLKKKTPSTLRHTIHMTSYYSLTLILP